MKLFKTVMAVTAIMAVSTSALAASVMPGQIQTGCAAARSVSPAAAAHSVSSAYTGVIVDASGLGLESTFSPVVYDTNGRAIYGTKNIDPDIAISQGMVGYADSLKQAFAAKGRTGANPLMIKAVAVQGGSNSANKVNVVISVEDGNKVLRADEGTDMLRRCAVVFVR